MGNDEKISIKMLRASGFDLVDEAIAVALSEALIRRHYGEAELSSQSPLIVKDGGDKWIVSGNIDVESRDRDLGSLKLGKLRLLL
ncbi:NTF2 fold immunity protein [Lacibacterium aquatile]|uniref:NTF2 fold immunity protein n=1 Tax=Lacibacterium aquatile TaxID=1168082 RepID=UPI0036D28041